MKYRMYVDEVGNSDLGSSDLLNHRFLSLTGIVIELEYVRDVIFPELEELKSKYFISHPDEPVIFHRKELVNYRIPFAELRDDRIRASFNLELINCLKKWNYQIITVCLDKKNHKEIYSVWRYDPYHYSMALLIERFVFLLEQIDSTGDVLAESRGGKEDRRLKESFTKLFLNGTDYVEPERIQKVLSSKQLKVKPKKNNIAGLQIADILAHPSRNEILCENNIKGIRIAPFAKIIIQVLQDKYYKVDGKLYGKKFI